MNEKIYFIYLILCANGNYYTGYTTDLARRYREHQLGTTKCKYTRSFKPLRLSQCWQVIGDRSEAMKIEHFIKKMNRNEKENLILFPQKLNQTFKDIKLSVGDISCITLHF